MVEIDVSDGDGVLFSIEVKSLALLNRNRDIITHFLQQYMFQLKTESLLNEMKQKVQIILESDIYNQRKQKLKRINKIYEKDK